MCCAEAEAEDAFGEAIFRDEEGDDGDDLDEDSSAGSTGGEVSGEGAVEGVPWPRGLEACGGFGCQTAKVKDHADSQIVSQCGRASLLPGRAGRTVTASTGYLKHSVL